MALKIISFIFFISLAFGIPASTQIKDVPFDVNEVIKKVNRNSRNHPKIPHAEFQIPNLEGEFLIDTNIIYVPVVGDQNYPAIAFDGTNYLVVWEDWRSGSYSDIYGARVSQAGTVLDPNGIYISTAGYFQFSPAIAFDGTNYLVVWENDSDIYGARVSQAGTVLDPTGLAISTAANHQELPAIAFDGTNYLVVWQDQRSGSNDIYGARVSQAGTVLDPTGLAISTAANHQELPAIAFDGTNYLVVWQDWRSGSYDIYGSRVSQAGTVLDPNGIVITTAVEYPEYPIAITFGGTNYLVVWQELRSGSFDDIYGTRVSQAGTVLDPDGIAISTAEDDQWSPAVAFDGINYLVVWGDIRSGNDYVEIYGSRISQAGTVLDTNGFRISTTFESDFFPGIAFGGTNYLVVWSDELPYSFSSYDIYGVRVSQAGIVLDPNRIRISTVINEQWAPAIASDGTNYLVVWEDDRSGNSNIYGIRVSQNGAMLDSNCIVISRFGGSSPSVNFDGINYFVVWSNYGDIFGTRVSQVGTVLDPNGIVISTGVYHQRYPSTTFDGTNYLVVWEEERSGYVYDIYGARVNQAGVVLDPNGIQISTAANRQYSPAIAFDGTNYLVVWQDDRSSSYEYDIYGARVSQTGTVLDPNGIAISIAANDQELPAIAFDGTNYLVLWQDERNASWDIYGARVTQTGTVLDPNGFAISTAVNSQGSPAIVFDGTYYITLWTDYRNGSSSDIYGAKVSSTGALIDSFQVSIQDGNQGLPALAHGSGNQILFTYEGWTDEYRGRIYNTMRIWGKFYPFIGIEEENPKVKMQKAKLLEVYPNPATGVVRVRYLPPGQDLKIYNTTGRLVKSFWFEPIKDKRSMPNEIIWNGTDDSGKKLPAGVYLCRLKAADGSTETKEIIIMR